MKINCKKCNAPLSLLGNTQRCRYLVCEYCGTVMDTRDDFKALYSFTHTQQNNNIRIGQTYTFHNIEFTVTGFVTYQSQKAQWQEYQLYSITHGYAKLIVKDNKIIFLRRTHYLPQPNIWLLTNNENFVLQDKSFTITSFDATETYYAAGNLLDEIKPGKRTKQCFAKSDNQWFHSMYQRTSVAYFVGYENTSIY